FDFSPLNLEDCVHNGDLLSIPFSYHGTWYFGFPIININASLVDLSTGNTIDLASTVEADHNPNDDGWPAAYLFVGSGTVYLQLPEGLPFGNYQLNMNVTYTNFQGYAEGHYATTNLEGEVHCHDYGVGQGSTTYDCILPMGNLCVIPCNIDVTIETQSEYGYGELITSMTATAVSNSPESYEYLWSDESTAESVTINCGNETFSLTVTNPLTGCVRVFSEIHLQTSVACAHGGPKVIEGPKGPEGPDGDELEAGTRSAEEETSGLTERNERSTSAMLQRVYPNPSSGIYTILLDQPVAACTISVYSLASGKLVLSSKHSDTREMKLDITHQPADIYVLQILVGGEIFYKKIVKI
ncbi:MAG: T9SS type A sorting domain-containing protein, partial [Bacteroidota bacterium]